jgi:thiosulfate/3-mercaptopyruvate sulfurtransferase
MTFARSTSTAIPAVKPASDALCSPAWLAAHLYDADVRVVEVDISSAAYDEWHIDAGVLWDIYRDLKDPDYRLVDAASLAALLMRSGITPETTVVFYGYAPAFGLWLLEAFGHPGARILDCDRNEWRAKGRPWATTASQPTCSQYTLGEARAQVRSNRHDVDAAISRPDTILLDVRSTAEYEGQRFWPSGGSERGGRAGHIPSAVHQPIDGLYNPDGSFRHAADLRAVFSAVDADGQDELITYCTIGARAATAWFVLTHLLGRANVSVYDGSWAEWGRLPDTPIVQSQATTDDKEQKMPGLIRKSFDDPEEVRPFQDGTGLLEVVNLDAGPVGRATFLPGWRWSEHVKPIAKTDSCQAAHTGYFVSGRMKVVMEDGEEMEYGPGDFASMAPGHDAWIVGDDPCVVIDWQGFADYAKPDAP